MVTERILERVGPKKEEVPINRDFISVGRMRESDLVCLSLLVSREHCLFTSLATGLYVTDLGSSNGVFVNGKPIKPKKQFLLKDNDYIGIGSAELTNLDATMFVYQLKTRVTVDDCDSSTPRVEQESVRLSRKEQSRQRKSDDSDIPAKILKTGTEYVHNIDDDDDDDDDDCIEIIDQPCTSSVTSSRPISKVAKSKEKSIESSTEVAKKNTIESECRKEDDPCSISANPIAVSNNSKKIVQSPPDIIDITDTEVPKNIKVEPMEAVEKNVVEDAKIIKQEQMDTNVAEDCNQENVVSIKQEPDYGSFSQIDLVEIEDDDDEALFPSSQLFDKTGVKEECEDNDGTGNYSSIYIDDEEENLITIIDSDNEDVCDGNEAFDYIRRIKVEPALEPEFIDVDKAMSESMDSHLEMDRDLPEDVPESTVETSDELPQTTLESTAEKDNIDPEIFPEFVPETVPETIPEAVLETRSKTADPKITSEKSKPSTSRGESKTGSSSRKGSSSSSKTKKKGPEIIEPHFIKPKKKSASRDEKKPKEKEDSDRTKKSSTDSSRKEHSKDHREKSSSKSDKNKKVHSKSSSKSSSSSGSSSKDKKSSSHKHKSSSSSSEKANDEADKEKKKGDESNKKSDQSDSGLSTSSFNETLNQEKPKYKLTNVKVKVSSRSRGDMLCDSMVNLRPTPRTALKKSNPENTKLNGSKSTIIPATTIPYVIPRRQVPTSSIPATSALVINQANAAPPSPPREESTSAVLTNATNNLNIVTDSFDCSKENKSSSLVNETVDHNDISASTSAPLKSSILGSSLNTTQKKAVSFKENIVAVREFPIEAGNNLRNIKQGISIRSTKKDFSVNRSLNLKLEDFLARVFVWEPVWLEQQKKFKELPPIVKKEDMQFLPNTFVTYEQYYKRMEVLLLLETWQQLVKEYDCTGTKYSSSPTLFCKMERHSIKQMQTQNGLRYSSMCINVLVSKNDLRLKRHPVFGDMIILEYAMKETHKWRRAFAYIVDVVQQNSLKYLRLNEDFAKKSPNPEVLLTFFVQTRIIDEHTVDFEQIARLRSILYLRPQLRSVNGLQYVPHSALRDIILKCNVDEFELKAVSKSEIHNYQIVTQEKLNDKQMEAVIKFTNISVNKEPKIGLLVGPPGTGKSKVIANLVTQILYGDGRYVNGRHGRILVCAPSNAAIDEIVLRLLDIRGAIKDSQKRFKMVRIGRIESMHEEVKKISVSELARREAMKLHSDQQHKTGENVEKKKYDLKKSMEALEILISNSRVQTRETFQYKRDLDMLKQQYKKFSNKRPEDEAIELSKIENNVKNVMIKRADVIACTLSSCYTSQMESIFGGEVEKIGICIVDEATQCCEAETLIPLILGVRSLILVGDPNQLPATVMSNEAKKLGLDRSLFTRVKEALEYQKNDVDVEYKDPIIMLNVQYRMVNAISYWPNKYFYAGKLQDAVPYRQAFPYQPYRVLNLDGLQDNNKFSNTNEALFVGNLINCMMTCANLSSYKKILVGIITPYQNQKSVVQSTINEQTRNVPAEIRSKFVIEVNTIDSFQGQERDVIIMSCVRSSGIGFMSDKQRLCVALTRAKFSLIVCGNFTTFKRDTMWKDLLQDAYSRGVVAKLNTSAKPNDIKSHVVRIDKL